MLTGYSPEQIRRAEAPALAAGVPLMEQAAKELAVTVSQNVAAGGSVLVLIGGGNNGGDGLFAASYLARDGYRVTAVLAHPDPHRAGLAAAQAAGMQFHTMANESEFAEIRAAAAQAQVWVDALAGIGLSGELRGQPRELMELLAPVRQERGDAVQLIAADVPSGVIPADITVTFGALKPALLLPPAASLAGRIELVPLPIEFTEQPVVHRIELADVAGLLPPARTDDHKYSRGVVEIHAGSTEYPGAGVLTSGGALRSGAGMVRYRGAARELVLQAWPEVVTVPGKHDAVVIGPGGAVDDAAHRAFLQAIAEEVPTIIDAGALDLLPHEGGGKRPILLTPHAGELARFLSVSTSEVLADVAGAAVQAADLAGAVVLAKGAITVVATPGAQVLYSQGDATPWLATAGSGDVLAGIAGTIAAQLKPKDAAAMAQVGALAAAIHGWAGKRAAAGGHPIVASDVITALPEVFAQIYR